jgi:hypothetical protein
VRIAVWPVRKIDQISTRYTDEQLELLTGFLRRSVAFQEQRMRRLEELKARRR